MIQRFEFDENKKLADDVLRAYYAQHKKKGSPVKLEGGGQIRFTKRNRKHGLQHGNGFFDAFAQPLVKFLVPSLVKGVGSVAISKLQGKDLKDSLKSGVATATQDAVLRKGQSLLTKALTA